MLGVDRDARAVLRPVLGSRFVDRELVSPAIADPNVAAVSLASGRTIVARGDNAIVLDDNRAVVLPETGSMVEKFRAILAADDCFGVFEQVKKLTTNYRVWNKVTDYIEQCFDFIEERLAAAKEQD